MATNKAKEKGPLGDIKGAFPSIAPWAALFINVVAGVLSLTDYYKKATDKAFTAPFSHVHYIDADGKYICGDIYINKKHICDGQFLNVRADKPGVDVFLDLGLTKEQYEDVQKRLKQFKCEGPHE